MGLFDNHRCSRHVNISSDTRSIGKFPLVKFTASLAVHPSSSRENTRKHYLFRGVVSSLKKIPGKPNSTLQVSLLAAWARVHPLECLTSNVTSGIWRSGRFADDVAVPCLNLLPMRVTDTKVSNPRARKAINEGSSEAIRNAIAAASLGDVSRWVG